MLNQEFPEYWDSEYPRFGDLQWSEGAREGEGGGVFEWWKDLPILCGVAANATPHFVVLCEGSPRWFVSGCPQEGWSAGRGVSFTEDSTTSKTLEDSPAEKLVSITEDKEDAAAMAIGFLNSWFQSYEMEMSSAEGPVALDSKEPAEEEREAGNFVYSAVHGYRIPKTIEQDSSMTYKKILRAIKGDEDTSIEGSGMQSVRNSTKLQPVDLEGGLRDQYVHQFLIEQELSLIQFYPLRVQSAKDEQLLTEQPERVIFADDIKSSLFVVSSKAARTRLFIRCLQSLGVSFPSASISPSIWATSALRATADDGLLWMSNSSDACVALSMCIKNLCLRGFDDKPSLASRLHAHLEGFYLKNHESMAILNSRFHFREELYPIYGVYLTLDSGMSGGVTSQLDQTVPGGI